MLKYGSFLFILLCLSVTTLQGQNYNNPGGTINACSGNFYDTGGTSGTYSTDESIITTFCPIAANKCLSIAFTSFDLELNFDELAIYDGPTASYPLIGSYTGTNSPGTLTAHNGCLTFIFDSDFSINRAGWRATMDCVPCPPPPPCTGTTPACVSSPPDICANACNLGTLNAPPLCPSTSSSVNVFCLSNIGATPSAPYLYLTGCQPSGTDMAVRAADVWYTFIASSNIIDISITGLSNPNIGLYEGNNCNTFIGRGCAVGAFGNLNASFQPIMAGRKYYLQISGGDTTETSDFTLTISGRNDCDPCVINAGLTASPVPLNGVYHGGTTVHFCLTITRWNPTSVNWLHGIVPTFGECWDLSTLVVYPPASCDNLGTWNWYNSVTSSQTGNVTGPGFFYESSLGCSVCDTNDPGDNYGDNCTGTVNFVFCWDITVAQCITGNNLNVSVNTYGDGETGSWTSYACAADPVFDFFATYASCSNPVLELKGVTCNGAADGRAIAEGQGTSPFNFVWLDSLGNILKTSIGRSDFDTLNSLPGGKYIIEQTNAVQCLNTIDFIIDEPAPLIDIITVSPLSCNASNDGSIDISLSGGATPYEFSIDGINFQSSNVFTDLNSGSYTVFSKDDSSCAVTENVIIPKPDPLVITLDSIINSSCSLSNNGAILITVSGGTIPYSFTWSNSAGTEDISNLSGGDYKLMVSDANGCTAIDTFSLINNPGISLRTSSVNVLCSGGNDGSIDLTVNGGTGPFIFSWSNSASSEDLNGIPSGTYTVTVTDANQCPDTTTVVITEPPPIALSGNGINILCNADNSGAIDLTASGGVLPFSFVWSNNAITEDISGVAAGNYSVTATDVNVCSDTISFALTQPDAIVLLSLKTDVSCSGGNDGAIDLSVNGGVLPYQFIWSNTETTEDIAGLIANIYDLIVIDSNSCTVTSSVTIIEPAALIINGIATDVLCNGESTGSVNITASGGVVPYNYQWSNSMTSKDLVSVIADSYSVIITDSNQCTITSIFAVAEPPVISLNGNKTNLICNIDSSGEIDLTASGGIQPFSFLWSNNSTTEDITGVPAGSYSVIATDDNACSATSSFTLTQPNSITLSLDKTDVSCAGGIDGAINLSVISGTLPFQFIWSNNASTEDLTGLSAGFYDVIVIDSNSCIATSSATINEPTMLAVNGIVTDVLCNGENSGKINITTSGGVTPYGYQWSNTSVSEDLNGIPAGNYMVTVSDENQCSDTLAFVVTEPPAIQLNGIVTNLQCNGDNSGAIDLNASGGVQPFSFEWSNNATTEDISGLAAENFSVIATDANSCTDTASFTLTQPDSIQLTHVLTNVSCAQGTDGAINITVTGGTIPYQFIWSNNAITEDLTGLTAADYDVIVIDFNTCNTTASFTITQPPPLSVTGVASDVLCAGESNGTVNITVTGGATPYNYQWSNSATLEDLIAVIADTYNVIATDANNCTATSGFVINEPDPLILSGFATDARCFTSTDGAINLSASGGILLYEFSIGSLFQTSPSFNNIPGGNYWPVVHDANNCTDSINLIINTPPPIATVMTTDSVSCFGGSDGTASLTASGVNGPFRYRWSDSSTSDSASNLAEGTYYVTVTDNNSCLAYDTATVSQPSKIELTAVLNDLQCNGENSGSINLNVSGGIPAYTYLWSGNQTTQNIDSLNASNYSVTITDNNNCTADDSYTVTEPTSITLTASATAVICNGDSNGIASVSASGGTPLYAYQWNAASGNQTTASAVNLPSGTYDVVVTDAHNCTATTSAEVTEPQLLVAIIDSSADPLCMGESSGFASALSTGGTNPVAYLWSNNPPTSGAVMAGVISGTYEVTATDGNGCTSASSVILNDPPPLSVTIFPANTKITYGDSVTLHAIYSPASVSPSYAWEPSNIPLMCVAPCADPTVVPSVPTTFTVYLTVQGSTCSASAQAFVDVMFNNDVQTPNVFSPDGDGVNDEFEVFYSPSLTGINYKIFNRWGEKLFETNTIGEFWDGTFHGALQNPGVYVYRVEGDFLDGEKKQYKGSLTLLR